MSSGLTLFYTISLLVHVFCASSSDIFTTQTTDSSIVITWKGHQDLGNNITEWKIYLDGSCKKTLAGSRFDGDGQERITAGGGLVAGSLHSLSVKFVRDGSGNEELVLERDVRLKPRPVVQLLRSEPGGPSNIHGAVVLKWSPSNKSIQDSYKVLFRSLYSEMKGWSDYQYTSATLMTLTDLVPGDRYQFKVIAISGGERSEAVMIEESIHPGKVTDMFALKSGSSSTSVAFSARAPDGILRSWFLQYIPTPCDCYWTHMPNFGMDNFKDNEYRGTLFNLEPGLTYRIQIAVQGVHGTHEDDTNRGAFTEMIYTTAPIINSSVELVRPPGDTTAELKFTPTIGAHFEYYLVDLIEYGTECSDGGCPHKMKKRNDNHLVVTFSNLKPGTHYEVNLMTISGGRSSRAIKLDFKTTGSSGKAGENTNLMPVIVVLAVLLCIVLVAAVVFVLLKRRRVLSQDASGKENRLNLKKQRLPLPPSRSVQLVPPIPRTLPLTTPTTAPPAPPCVRSISNTNSYMDIVPGTPEGSGSGYLQPLTTVIQDRDSGDYAQPYEKLRRDEKEGTSPA